MVSKGERTRAEIVEQAAIYFNQHGFAGTSISDIMRETGLEKGGIYNHFKNKDELALEAFDYAFGEASRLMLSYIKGSPGYFERLLNTVRFFQDYYANPPVPGGCMVLNTAIDSDDSHPALRERARAALADWRTLIAWIINKGIEKGEIAEGADAEGVANLIIGGVEGGIMMSQLYKDTVYINQMVSYLCDYLEQKLQP
jgi:AcrR family transcriptional regulator